MTVKIRAVFSVANRSMFVYSVIHYDVLIVLKAAVNCRPTPGWIYMPE